MLPWKPWACSTRQTPTLCFIRTASCFVRSHNQTADLSMNIHVMSNITVVLRLFTGIKQAGSHICASCPVIIHTKGINKEVNIKDKTFWNSFHISIPHLTGYRYKKQHNCLKHLLCLPSLVVHFALLLTYRVLMRQQNWMHTFYRS